LGLIYIKVPTTSSYELRLKKGRKIRPVPNTLGKTVCSLALQLYRDFLKQEALKAYFKRKWMLDAAEAIGGIVHNIFGSVARGEAVVKS
jgi:hypothetical protein